MKRRKPGGDSAALIKCILTGFGVGLLVMAALSLLTAVCVHLEKLPENAITYCVWAICALGAATGCAVTQQLAGRAHLTVGLGCALALALAIGAVHAIVSKGDGAAWRCAAICGLAAVVTALLNAGRGKRR
jgi:putative membrane protein (TIGR04086 family)